jgi:hypothetical protein
MAARRMMSARTVAARSGIASVPYRFSFDIDNPQLRRLQLLLDEQ